MKKLMLSSLFVVSAALSSSAFAGCGEWGKVNYVYASDTTVFAIINGTACSASSTDAGTVAGILAEARASGLQGYMLPVSSNGKVSAAIQYNP